MRRKRLHQIRNLASELLEGSDVYEPPVPVEKIAKSLGVQINYEPIENDVSGMFVSEGSRKIIGVNFHHLENRRRFTIAHELGHMLLHDNSEIHIDRAYRIYRRDPISSQAIDSKEIEANTFAAELLMPADMLRLDWGGRVAVDYEYDDFIEKLADRYLVSLQAMIFRLTNLGLISPQNL